jgi:branched-chain amino acid aminotransferase group I
MSPIHISVIHCWSAPRSRSTALLYSFEARGSSNCVAIDEPLYRPWLQHYMENGSNSISRPYTNELIQGIPHAEASDKDDHFKWERELKSLSERIHEGANMICSQCSKADSGSDNVIFVKHMAKHYFLYNFENEQHEHTDSQQEYILSHKHVLLIRDPVAILSSWNVAKDVHNNVSSDEVGIIPLLSIHSILSSLQQNIVVLDSDSLATDPQHTLKCLCDDLDIHYTDSMLNWPKGKHDCDGPWAQWWYSDVHKSNGWILKQVQNPNHLSNRKYRTLDHTLMNILRSSMPAYNYLLSLTNKYKMRGPQPNQIYEDPRNEHVIVYIGSPGHGRLLPRDMAGVSPFDSSVQGGDATWEGIRIYRGKIFKLERHLKRLFKSAKALGFENVHSKEEVIDAIFRTLAVNGMRDGAHMRLTLTRGEKCTSSMNPKFNVYGTTLIILPEWKPVEGGATTYDNNKGISLISCSTRRNSPSTCDSKIHHNNMINNILPKIQANLANCADALMLDIDGFVSETNATNIFMVDDGVLLTPHADHCLPGITRETVLMLAKELDIPVEVRRISLAEFHAADEVFTTGTMGELTPVTMIDGRLIGAGGGTGPVTERLQAAYSTLPEREGFSTAIPPFE